ncbi:protein FLX-like 3 [Phalaenopsis equestris]|uniref:protein FLX-like 3 n=1 Tax=Phalaenopsis equestris TaxID=78828 RepID=UPI0009E199E1|nr:protein FLX-like 3 [Phalaenopsis equestris]XP_020584765.1 protein FLX-like 3 [Phalaenopsis equestris]
MAGRNRFPRHQDPRGFYDGLQHPTRRHAPVPLHPIEEEIAIRRDEIRRLRADNHLLVEENVAFRREITAAKEELHVLGELIPKIRSDKEAQTRELIEKGMKLEKELLGFEPLRAEFLQLKSEAQKLDNLRKELSSDVQNMSKELKHIQAENQQTPSLRLEIEGLHQELARARTAYEYEKKANTDQLEQRQVLDKNLASMAREVEKLRAERLGVESRARGSGPTGAYGGEKGVYDSGSWLHYDHRGFPRH